MKNLYHAFSLLAIFVFAGYSPSFATSIDVSDTIHSDSTWSHAEIDTVRVTGDLTVADGAVLTIEPGIIVEFQGYFIFKINGSLIASGTEQDSIKFTVNPDSLSVGWQGLDILPLNSLNDTTRLKYCIIENSKRGGVRIAATNKVIVDHCRIWHNTYSSGTDWGAGMYIANSNPVITNNTIAYNEQVSGKGGGIYFSSSNVQNFSGNLICNNKAYTGGAINLNYSDIVSVNNIFVNNQGYYAGGMFILQSTPTFINNTIVNNKATSEGGGIVFSMNSNASFVNNIIGLNKDNSSYNQVYFYTTPGTQSFSYCDIEGDTADFTYGGSWAFTGNYSNNIDTMPEFINPTADADYTLDALYSDWNLSATSPCIDMGTPDTTGLKLPALDFYGNLRIFNDTVDIGAAERTCFLEPLDLGSDLILCEWMDHTFDVLGTYDSIVWMDASTNASITVDSAGTGLGTLVVYVTAYSGLCSVSDTVLVTFDVCPGITDQQTVTGPGFTYDPVSEMLLTDKDVEKGNWNIYSIDGRLLKAYSEVSVISVADYSPGIYIVKCDIGGKIIVRKISVQ